MEHLGARTVRSQLLHTLQRIPKTGFKTFSSAATKSFDFIYLTKSKGYSQLRQPNLFTLTVRDRVPGMGWVHTSVSRGSDPRLG